MLEILWLRIFSSWLTGNEHVVYLWDDLALRAAHCEGIVIDVSMSLLLNVFQGIEKTSWKRRADPSWKLEYWRFLVIRHSRSWLFFSNRSIFQAVVGIARDPGGPTQNKLRAGRRWSAAPRRTFGWTQGASHLLKTELILKPCWYKGVKQWVWVSRVCWLQIWHGAEAGVL